MLVNCPMLAVGIIARVKIKPDVTHSVPGAMKNALVIHSNAGKLVFGTLPQPGWLAQFLRDLA